MMKIKYSIPILLLIMLGCKKENSESKTVFPVNMYLEKAEIISDTKVYTKGGQLNDLQKTTELMWIYTRYFSLEQNLENVGQQYLSLISKDSVTFFNMHSPYVIQRTGDRLIMTSAIQFIASKPMLPDQLYHHVARYQNIKSEGDTEISRDVRLAYGNGFSELKIPAFAYVTSSRIEGPVSGLNRRGGLVINEFNEEVLKRIGERDTIIVKTYSLTVKAR
ncbi:MAG: hypothetical protein EOO88_13610 [Pedobacter sp.]|nr:MAG: hypothetical protein EOO88_13610 [Pedobacter sp.]